MGDNGRASIDKSGFDGAETLEFVTDSGEFESTPLEAGAQHLLTGGVGGTIEEVVGFVRSLSRTLTEAEVENRFEVYDERQELVQLVPP